MHTIWKYTLHPKTELEMPKAAEILTVGIQGDDIVMWAKVNPEAPLETRTFLGFGTGHDLPDQIPLKYVGTTLFTGHNLVFHIFEAVD